MQVTNDVLTWYGGKIGGGGTFFWDPEKYMTYCCKDKPRTEENELGKCELGQYSGKQRKLERDQLKFIPPILWGSLGAEHVMRSSVILLNILLKMLYPIRLQIFKGRLVQEEMGHLTLPVPPRVFLSKTGTSPSSFSLFGKIYMELFSPSGVKSSLGKVFLGGNSTSSGKQTFPCQAPPRPN